MRDAAATESLTPQLFCAALDRKEVQTAMMAAYGRPAHHCLKELPKQQPPLLARLHDGSTILRITGPVSDGFYVRALVVMAQSLWARRIGLPVSVAYRSEHDSYLDQSDTRRDGWSQFFLPIGIMRNSSSPARQHTDTRPAEAHLPGARLVQLDCYAGARAWEAYANYAPNFAAVTIQRRQRIELVRTLPVEPRRTFRQAASVFWQSHGLNAANSTLGVVRGASDRRRAHTEPQMHAQTKSTAPVHLSMSLCVRPCVRPPPNRAQLTRQRVVRLSPLPAGHFAAPARY